MVGCPKLEGQVAEDGVLEEVAQGGDDGWYPNDQDESGDLHPARKTSRVKIRTTSLFTKRPSFSHQWKSYFGTVAFKFISFMCTVKLFYSQSCLWTEMS